MDAVETWKIRESTLNAAVLAKVWWSNLFFAFVSA